MAPFCVCFCCLPTSFSCLPDPGWQSSSLSFSFLRGGCLVISLSSDLPLNIALPLSRIQTRIDNKLSTVCHNFFSDSSPDYLSDLLTVYTPSRQLRSSTDTWTLHIPILEQKPLASTVLQSNGFRSLLPPVKFRFYVFKTPLNTHLTKKYHR